MCDTINIDAVIIMSFSVEIFFSGMKNIAYTVVKTIASSVSVQSQFISVKFVIIHNLSLSRFFDTWITVFTFAWTFHCCS